MGGGNMGNVGASPVAVSVGPHLRVPLTGADSTQQEGPGTSTAVLH